MAIEERTEWNKIRARGRLDYVARIGIGLYGGLFALIVLAARFTVFHARTHWAGIWAEMLQFVLEAILFGLWAGLWTWSINEKRSASAGPIERRP